MKSSKKIMIIAILLSFASSSIGAELTELQQRVIADSEKVKTLNAQERRAFRKQIWNNEDVVAQRAYNRAYKDMTEAGLITFEKTKKNKANTTVSNTNQVSNRGPGQPTPNMIQYHSGNLVPATVTSKSVGNRFNTGGGFPVAQSGSITRMTVDMAAIGGGSAFISIYDQITGTQANQVVSQTFPMTTGLNTITFTAAFNYVGSEFLAGVWNFTAGTDTVNLATGTVGGQGFHGMEINDGPTGNDLIEYTDLNGAVGVSGPVTTPVELINFSVE